MQGLSDGTGYDKIEDRDYGDVAADYGRAAAQGLTFGFADEIEAGVRAALDSDADYSEVVAEVRNQINDFRDRNPAAAIGVEIAASVLPLIAAQFIPGAGQVAGASRLAQLGSTVSKIKSPLARTVLTSGGQGALYGFGVGEGGLSNRAETAATAGVLSSVGGGVMQKVAPHITAKAKELLKRGIPLTPGQAVRDSSLLGNTIATLEEKAASTLPFVGDAIKGAFDRTRAAFNRASVNEALDTIGVQAPKNMEGRALINFGQKKIEQSYDDVLENMKMTEQMPLFDGVFRVVENANKDIRDDILDRAEKLIFDRFDDAGGVLAGRALKEVQSRLRKDLTRLRRAGFSDETQARKADAIEDILAVFSHQLAKQNPKLAKRLNDVDQAYGNFEIVRNASIRRKLDETFTPGDLLAETARADPTKRKSQFSGGAARMQQGAQTAQDVIGRTIPDSGTAGRMEATKLLTGGSMLGGTFVEPTVGVPLIGGGTSAYSRLGVPVSRSTVGLAGTAMKQAVPVGSALLASRITQSDALENARRRLAQVLSGE